MSSIEERLAKLEEFKSYYDARAERRNEELKEFVDLKIGFLSKEISDLGEMVVKYFEKNDTEHTKIKDEQFITAIKVAGISTAATVIWIGFSFFWGKLK